MPALIKANVKNTSGRRLLVALAAVALILVGAAENVAAKTPGKAAGTKVFPSPEAAVQALMDAVKNGDERALLAIFGKEGKDLQISLLRLEERERSLMRVLARGERIEVWLKSQLPRGILPWW